LIQHTLRSKNIRDNSNHLNHLEKGNYFAMVKNGYQINDVSKNEGMCVREVVLTQL